MVQWCTLFLNSQNVGNLESCSPLTPQPPTATPTLHPTPPHPPQLPLCGASGGVCTGPNPTCRCIESFSVSALLPITTTPAPPDSQWWVATQAQSGAASLVNLASEVAGGANTVLTTSPPGGVTAAVKLTTPTTNVNDKIDVAINYPGTPPGLFVGMRFQVSGQGTQGLCVGVGVG